MTVDSCDDRSDIIAKKDELGARLSFNETLQAGVPFVQFARSGRRHADLAA